MAQNLESRSGQEFRVSFEGMELPPEAVELITHAIQKAVLAELAGMDLPAGSEIRSAGFETRFLGSGGGGGTQGMRIIGR